MSYQYKLDLIGYGVEFRMKDYVEDADLPDLDEFDDYPGNELETYLAQSIDSGSLLVEQINEADSYTEYDLAELHRLYSREAFCSTEPEDYAHDQVVYYRGEGKSGLGSVELELDEPFDINKISLGVVETHQGDYAESLFYGLKELKLDMTDTNFGTFSVDTEVGYISKDDWDNKAQFTGSGSRLAESIEDLLEEQPHWPND